jgi:hypothetical protein
VFRALTAGNRAFNAGDKKIGLFAMIACDITLVIGIYQWLTGPYGLNTIKNLGMKAVMADKVYRFFAIEHLTGMIIAIALVHIGKSYAKKNIPDAAKHKKTLLFFGLALLVILISVPWPFRVAGAGRGWF